jgi:hypothetical protein
MTSMAPSESKLMPFWAVSDFRSFLDKNERLQHVLRLSINGIHMIRARPQALKALAAHDNTLTEAEDKIRQAEADKDLAQREVEHDFPLLHEQATIALWSSLEALVRSFLATWLANKPDAWEVDAVKKLKVKVGDYMSLEALERSLWIVDLIDQEVGGPFRLGVTRFESILQPFGLAGEVDDRCQKALFELSQVRHVLVHRSGVVDKRFADACPWLALKPGQHLLVSHKMWRTYNEALASYVLELIQRVRVHFGLLRYVHGEAGDAFQETHPK